MFEGYFSLVLIRVILAILLISIVSSVAGSLAVFKKSTFAVTGIAHAALGGAAFGILMTMIGISFISPLVGELIFAIAMAVFIGTVTAKSHDERTDLVIGVSFAFVMSLTVLLISLIRDYASVVWGYLVGDIMLLTNEDVLDLFVLAVITMFIVVLFFRYFVYVSFDPESAKAFGINVTAVVNALYIVIAMSVVISIKAIGTILVYVFMTLPPAIANGFSKKATQVIIYTFAISFLSGILGLVVAMFFNIAPSAIMGLIITLLYAVARLTFRKKQTKNETGNEKV